jgi:tartrate-resistant acid phosphatase type 5
MHGNNTNLFKSLKPILEAGHIDLYLTGHDHDYERFAPVNGVTYIVSGGGGASLRPFGLKPVTGSLVRHATLQFMQFEATPNQLRYTAINSKGLPIDEGVISHQASVVPLKKAR